MLEKIRDCILYGILWFAGVANGIHKSMIWYLIEIRQNKLMLLMFILDILLIPIKIIVLLVCALINSKRTEEFLNRVGEDMDHDIKEDMES